MGVRYPSVASTTFVGPFPANATETVVCTSPPFTPPLDSSQIFIQWFFACLVGASITSFFYRLRRGTTTAGQLLNLNNWAIPVAAAGGFVSSGVYVDNPGAVSGQQYSLTVAQTAATGASSVPDVCLIVFAL